MHKTEFDKREVYCRKLGHHLSFRYCRAPASESFCPLLESCWSGSIPVSQYLAEFFSSEQMAAAVLPPPDKISALSDLIKAARSRRSG